MDNTKDKVVDALDLEEEENVEVEVETSDDQPGANTDTTNNNNSIELQQIEDDAAGLPLPMGMAEVISHTAEGRVEVEVEQIDDNDGPELPASMLEASLNAADPQIASKTSAILRNNVSSVNETSPPVPFNSAEYEDTEDVIAKKKAKEEEINQQKPAAVSTCTKTNEKEKTGIPLVGKSVHIPTSKIIEGGEGMSDNTIPIQEEGIRVEGEGRM